MKLPSVFANQDINLRDNNDSSVKLSKHVNKENLLNYFDKDGYVNKLNVTLRCIDGIRDEKLILHKDNYVITINNEKISLDDIIDFKVKK